MQSLRELKDRLDGLSEPQREAVITPGNLAIFACPGSGKTHTLSVKATRLLAENSRIRLCAVTFTNESASELRERIRRAAPMAGKRLMVGTFHSLCKDQLKASGRRNLSVLSPFEQSDLVRKAWHAAAPGSRLDDVVKFIEHAKSTLIPRIENIDSNPLEAAFQHYQEELERLGKSDFADLIRDAVLGMRERSVEPLNVEVMLVDEFQDADEVQLEWVSLHARDGVEVTVVGDDDQSLYGWRHALGYAGMMQFQQQCHAQLIRLDDCYRCAPVILSHARSLIEFNSDRQSKTLTAIRDIDGSVAVRGFPSGFAQAQAVCDQLQHGTGSWAILARTNADLDEVDSMLTAEGIEFARIGGKRFWDGNWPSAYRSILRSLATGDRMGVDLLVGLLGLHEDSLNVYRKHLPRRGERNNLDSLIRFRPPLGETRSGDAATLNAYLDRLASWLPQARGQRPNLVLIDAAEMLAQLLGREAATEVLAICSASLCRMTGTLAQRLQKLNLKPESNKKAGANVQLMTLHGSKGLEFDNIWIVNVEEDVLPHKKGELQEERRLAYVGMTRARRALTLSYRTARWLRNQAVQVTPSRFIYEAGLEKNQ